jgi:CRISPR/Cas system-associated exonuclease Cas4 (RecB family)
MGLWTNINEGIKGVWSQFGGRKEKIELSYSRIQAYKKCPWFFKLVYNDGLRSSPNGSMSLGMSLHRALAGFLNDTNPIKTVDRLMQIYDEVWVNAGFSSTQATLDSYDAGRKMLQNFFEIERDRLGQVMATEKNFSIGLDGVQLMGQIDRIDKADDGAYEIVEYKTQSEHWTPSRMACDLQLTLYEIGAKEGLGLTPLRLKYFFLSDGTQVITQRREEQRKAAMDTVFDVADKIRRKIFDPNPAYCDRCEFGQRCSKFKQTKEPARV